MSRVSVVLPCFNGARFLDRSLGSLVAQTRAPDEVLVVDDGSTDDSAAVLSRWAGEGRLPLRVVTQPNAGSARARSRGFAEARGELVGFLDQDDGWRPEALALLAGRLEADPQLGMAHGNAEWCDAELRPTGTRMVEGWTPPSGRILAALVEHGNFIPQSATMLRKSLWDEAPLFRQEHFPCDDYDLYLRLAARLPCAYVDAVVLDYRSHPGQFSRNRLALAEKAFEVLRARAEDGTLATLPPALVDFALRRAFESLVRQRIIVDGPEPCLALARRCYPGEWQIAAWIRWRGFLRALRGMLGLKYGGGDGPKG